MAPEIAGITCLAAVGMKAALNWKTPESVESSYSSIWKGLLLLSLVPDGWSVYGGEADCLKK
jgi:hypothetical protein